MLKVKDYLIKNKAKESNIQLLYDVIVFLIENVVESNQKPESDLNKIYAISKILNKNSLYATCYNTLLVTISRSFEERGNLIMATDINLFLLENINFNAPEDVNIERLKIYKDPSELSIKISMKLRSS
ncbi:MAG: hypothetical protein IPN86_18695 [Saprospiraceae bacterium]|nr:hypothetical protein [Saprospiraceae bacterium]